jgi:hypothetical protein
MESDEQGVIVQEQAKLAEIKVDILLIVNTAHDIDVLIVFSVAIFYQQQIFHEQGIGIAVGWLCGILCATSLATAIVAMWLRAQILVDEDVQAANLIHFGYGLVQKLVIVLPVGAIKA